jgi:hypothetical protein
VLGLPAFLRQAGKYRIDGQAFVYNEKELGSIRTILGYPTQLITGKRDLKISNIFG